MLLVPIPWAGRTWALPFLSVLAPSERYDAAHGRRHKAITDWARQMVRVVHRWCPRRPLVLVGDTAYAALEFLAATRAMATIVTRLRLDARLFAPAAARAQAKGPAARRRGPPANPGRPLDDPSTAWTPLRVPFWYGETNRTIEIVSRRHVVQPGLPPVPLRWVLIRDPDDAFPPQALLCTDLDASPKQIVSWFVLRWQMESTFHEVRDHLGVETGRGWSEKTIRRTTPALLGLFSFVTLVAHEHWSRHAARPGRRLVPQTGADLRRRHRRCAPFPVGAVFSDVPVLMTCKKSPVPWLIICARCSATPPEMAKLSWCVTSAPHGWSVVSGGRTAR